MCSPPHSCCKSLDHMQNARCSFKVEVMLDNAKYCDGCPFIDYGLLSCFFGLDVTRTPKKGNIKSQGLKQELGSMPLKVLRPQPCIDKYGVKEFRAQPITTQQTQLAPSHNMMDGL